MTGRCLPPGKGAAAHPGPLGGAAFLVSALLLGLPVPVHAQIQARASAWEVTHQDDGSFFAAALGTTGQPDIALICGEKSPRGLTAAQTGNTEPDITGRDTLRLVLGDDAIGGPDANLTPRTDVMLVVGTTGYRIPQLAYNELFGAWEADLPANDAVFEVIADAAEVELRSAQRSIVIPTLGFPDGLRSLTLYCQTMFAMIGKPWAAGTGHAINPTPGPAQIPPASGSMRTAAEARLWQGCGGAFKAPDSAFLSGEIDGDGIPDVLLDWGSVTCLNGIPRPFCGASQCAAEAFVSSVLARRGAPIDFLGLGASLVPLTNGNMAVSMGGSMSSCAHIGKSDCAFLYYWNGNDLVLLP